MKHESLNGKELSAMMASLPDWQVLDGQLNRHFEFENFSQAFAFMTQVAMIAEQFNHHPIWSNAYNVVAVNLSSHEINGISILDFQMAQAINGCYRPAMPAFPQIP